MTPNQPDSTIKRHEIQSLPRYKSQSTRVPRVVVKRFKVVRARYFHRGDDPPLKISRKNLKRWRGIRSGDVTTILDGENERGNYTVKKIERERERGEKGRSRGILSAKGKLMVIEGYRVIRVGETSLE